MLKRKEAVVEVFQRPFSEAGLCCSVLCRFVRTNMASEKKMLPTAFIPGSVAPCSVASCVRTWPGKNMLPTAFIYTVNFFFSAGKNNMIFMFSALLGIF